MITPSNPNPSHPNPSSVRSPERRPRSRRYRGPRQHGERATLAALALASGIASGIALLSDAASASERGAPVPAQQWFEALLTPEIDDSRIGSVQDVTLRREVATFRFEWGVFHFFEPTVIGDAERVTGAIFTGKGTMTYSPTPGIERRHLAIFAGADSVTRRFEVLYLRFADGTFEELEPRVEWTGKRHAHPEAKKKYCEEFVGSDTAFSLLQSALLGRRPGYFYAHVGPEGDPRKPYFYEVDPLAQEEIEFSQRSDVDVGHRRELINRFHLPADYETGEDLAHEESHLADATHYEIEAAIEKNGGIGARSAIHVVAREGPLWALGSSLMRKVQVRAVRTVPERPVSFHRARGSSALRFFFGDPLAPGDSLVLVTEYAGTALEKTYDGFSVLDPAGWYPSFGRVHATFDLRYSCPKDYQVLSVGHRVDFREEGKRSRSRFVSEEPIRFAAFNFGKFRHYALVPTDTALPPVTVYMTEEGRRLKQVIMKRAGIRTVDNPEEIVARNMVDAIKLFQWAFGACPLDSISVTQVPDRHGISFPGLVHLSFAGRHTKNMEAFHGHEMAHQWWGNAVAPRTYHDTWLSEGMAEFWGDYYVGWSQKNERSRLAMLRGARHHLVENRKAFRKDRTPVAPLWFGTRASSSRTGLDYWLVIYEKGAFVLQMLRSLLLDLRTLTDEDFLEMIRTFYARYEGREVSTADFQRHVEGFVGMDMTWFFDQWVYGTDIPTYRFGWGYTPRDDGRYLVQCTVEQKHVPEDFRMYVIVKVEFDGGQYAHFRVLVDEPVKRFALPPLPLEPRDVVFNDLESVLAEVESL